MSAPELKIIVAHGKNYEIGHKGRLCWPLLPSDMNFFKTLTTQVTDGTKRNVCIMGRKTYESIPSHARPLKGRINIVLSKNPHIQIDHIHTPPDQTTLIYTSSFEKALNWISTFNQVKYKDEKSIESTFIIGGAEIYKLALQSGFCKEIYETTIDSTFEADTFFPLTDLTHYKPIDTQIYNEKGYTYWISHRVLSSSS